MFILKILILIIIILLALCLFILVKSHKKTKDCYGVGELYNSFLSHKEKYSYKRLNKSNSYEKILLLSITKFKQIFCQKFLQSKLANLMAISKFIDYKINKNNQKFRTKNNLILIEQIASVVAFSVFKDKKCNLFELYKKLRLNYNLRQKEDKIFKFLLGKFLIDNLYDVESEIVEISRIIDESKTVQRLKNYKKQIYLSAEIYSIKKFNPNATKILDGYNYDYLSVIKNLFSELTEALEKERIIISYLLVMFL